MSHKITYLQIKDFGCFSHTFQKISIENISTLSLLEKMLLPSLSIVFIPLIPRNHAQTCRGIVFAKSFTMYWFESHMFLSFVYSELTE